MFAYLADLSLMNPIRWKERVVETQQDMFGYLADLPLINSVSWKRKGGI